MEKRDTIEKLVLKQLDELNNNEPAEGHFERFASRLQKQKSHRKRNLWGIAWKVAAAAVFAFLLVNQTLIWIQSDQRHVLTDSATADLTLASVSPEYEEVEFYYTSAISGGINQWEKLVAEGLVSEAEQQMMNSELAEFEEIFKNLQSDLSDNPNDERVVNAMIKYYQTKLSLITMILEKLEEVKKLNNSNHETSN